MPGSLSRCARGIRALAPIAARLAIGFAASVAHATIVQFTQVPSGGVVTSNAQDLQCGNAATACTTGNPPSGDPIELLATPDPGCTFGQWILGGIGTVTTNPVTIPLSAISVPAIATFRCMSVLLDVEGMGQGLPPAPGASVAPSNAQVAVGPTHLMQIVAHSYAIFDRQGVLQAGPTSLDTFWTATGGNCAGKTMGRIAYDAFAGRWVLAQKSNTGSRICLATSLTSDPGGAWQAIEVPLDTGVETFRLGIWPDGYYFAGGVPETGYLSARVCAVDRAALLQGQAAAVRCLDLPAGWWNAMPADLDGTRLPPTGSPAPILSTTLDRQTIALFRMRIDWSNPGGAVLEGPVEMAGTAFGTSNVFNGLPQAGTTNRMRPLLNRFEGRAAYRRFEDHESIVATMTVDGGTGSRTLLQTYEFRDPGGVPVVHRAGSYGPTGDSRFTGAIAMDRQGNQGIVHYASSAAIRPQARFTGRLAYATTAFPGNSETFLAGTGFQDSVTNTNFAQILVPDPVDDCALWSSVQYQLGDGTGFDWRTRIVAFRFNGCVSLTRTALATSANPVPTGQPVTFVATVTAYAPTGTVTFRDGATVLCAAVPLAGSQAPCTPPALSAGSHAITARYDGDPLNEASLSPTLLQMVSNAAQGADLGVAISASPAAGSTGKDFVQTFTVTNAGPGTATGVMLATTTSTGAEAVWATPGCTRNAAAMTCDIGALPPGASVQRKLVLRTPFPLPIATTALARGAQADPDGSNDEAGATVTIARSPAGKAVQRYRLFSPVTLEHLYTTDLNEYNVLGSFVGTWVQEGTIGKVYDNPGAFNAVDATPYYRLYNASNLQHHWTTDPNEYYTLLLFPQYSGEGVDGYIFPTQAPGTIPLFRLLYPFSVPVAGLHHWTIDANEYNALIASFGWVGEGGSGFVIP